MHVLVQHLRTNKLFLFKKCNYYITSKTYKKYNNIPKHYITCNENNENRNAYEYK